METNNNSKQPPKRSYITQDHNACLQYKEWLNRLHRNNEQSLLYKLSTDLLSHIVLFLSINDYCFGFLQTSRYTHHHLSPHNKPHLIRNLIINEGSKCWFNQAFLTTKSWEVGCFEYTEYASQHNVSYVDPLSSWNIAGAMAWTNINRNTSTTKTLNVCNKHKVASLKSSLYLLNFITICRYGGLKRTSRLKQLLWQILPNAMGALGIRYMLYFYLYEFCIHPINTKTNLIVNIKYGAMMKKIESVDQIKIEQFLCKLYFEGRFMEYLGALMPFTMKYFFGHGLKKSNIIPEFIGFDPFSSQQIQADIFNIYTICRKLFTIYSGSDDVIKGSSCFKDGMYKRMLRIQENIRNISSKEETDIKRASQ